MSDTTLTTCFYCHEETDCIPNENGHMMCQECRLIEDGGEKPIKKYTVTKFHENSEVETWGIEAESLEQAQADVLEDQGLHIEEKD